MHLDKLLSKTQLPILNKLEEIKSTLAHYLNLLINAEPGAGKTTIVPLALLDTIANNKKILMLEPRRLAAKNAAFRMASMIGESPGETIGYRIRNETNIGKDTRIEVITEGILTRMLQSDPELPDIGLIIFDEFHERNLHSDLGLALAFEVQQTLREDLKLLVMSATLDTQAVAKLLDNAPVVHCYGRSFPVDLTYIPPKPNQNWSHALIQAVRKILTDPITQMDTLVFLPGLAEIKKAETLLAPLIKEQKNIVILPLYGNLPFSKQQAAILPIKGKRKIILSTNIAESSLTIEDIDCVIDTGLVRQSHYDPNVGFDRLLTQKISQASSVQRMGRAGRTAPGLCIRLWHESDSLRAESQPEILRTDLTTFSLELAHWGINNTTDLSLLNQPNNGAIQQANKLLEILGATTNRQISEYGKTLLSLGVHPRIGHMLLTGANLQAIKIACLLASMLEEKDIFQGSQADTPDFMLRIESMINSQLHTHTTKNIQKQAKSLEKKLLLIIKEKLEMTPPLKQLAIEKTLHLSAALLAKAFPDRLAQKRGNGYRMANGSGAQLITNFPFKSDFIVIIKLGGQSHSAKIYQALEITQTEIEKYFSNIITEKEQIIWDENTKSVKGYLNRQLGKLILSSTPINKLEPEQLLTGLLNAIRKIGIEQLPWSHELKQWQARVGYLRQLEKYGDNYPNLENTKLAQTIEQWLAPFLASFNKLEQITADILSNALKSHLDWNQQQKLDDLMPKSIRVASGSTIKLDYLQGEKPILAVKLQEMFGTETTPLLANGKIPVVVHLLSPTGRPLQITEDLASFWKNSYELVKKEMKGRYPKHPWPDDPLKAQATRYTKKKFNSL
ncbi:ATP-dependent helicase HrpB [Aliikangiella sp. IMCC44359]|uniref:ATP-dependent helicase HrpB n=1 Tax=Aliikangiella sp. IMCC44359 TaxID=3459125 RepID=UPI00403ABB08